MVKCFSHQSCFKTIKGVLTPYNTISNMRFWICASFALFVDSLFESPSWSVTRQPCGTAKAMRFGADSDFMRLAFRCIFASIWICAWMLLLWCACLLCRFYGCVYSLYLCPCLRLCLCLCRCTGPCACALCLCMCIACASIHQRKFGWETSELWTFKNAKNSVK